MTGPITNLGQDAIQGYLAPGALQLAQEIPANYLSVPGAPYIKIRGLDDPLTIQKIIEEIAKEIYIRETGVKLRAIVPAHELKKEQANAEFAGMLQRATQRVLDPKIDWKEFVNTVKASEQPFEVGLVYAMVPTVPGAFVNLPESMQRQLTKLLLNGLKVRTGTLTLPDSGVSISLELGAPTDKGLSYEEMKHIIGGKVGGGVLASFRPEVKMQIRPYLPQLGESRGGRANFGAAISPLHLNIEAQYRPATKPGWSAWLGYEFRY